MHYVYALSKDTMFYMLVVFDIVDNNICSNDVVPVSCILAALCTNLSLKESIYVVGLFSTCIITNK